MINFLKPDQRTVVLIDGSNLYSTTKLLNIRIDYMKVYEFFQNSCDLLRINYYTCTPPQEEYDPLRSTYDWLSYNGYNLKSRPAKEYIDHQTGTRRIKGNVDVDIAVDMMLLCKKVDHIVLMSGDGDFCTAVEAVQNMGTRVSVISSHARPHPTCSDDLRRAADTFVDISELAPIWERSQI